MKGVTRIEGLRLVPDFPFHLLRSSESSLWHKRLASCGAAVATNHGPPLVTLGTWGLALGAGSVRPGLGRQARQRARKLLRSDQTFLVPDSALRAVARSPLVLPERAQPALQHPTLWGLHEGSISGWLQGSQEPP